MRRGHTLALTGAALTGAALIGTALAVTAAPTDAQRQQAVSQGEALAAKHQGYPVADYVLYSVPDALTLSKGEGSVEAVQLATPLERARWGSYFLTIQGKPVTPGAVQKIADLPANSVAFIVYAHSQSGDEKNQDFLKNFGAARLTLGGQTLTPAGTERSGASRNNYRDEDNQVVFRWTGTITYRFSVPPGAAGASGRLRFTDADGKSYDLPLDLAKYR